MPFDDPALRVVEEQGCYTPASPLPPRFFIEFPDTIGTLNWEYTLNAGAYWFFYPPVSQNEPVSAAFGDVRYRNTFAIPEGYSGTFAVTISGDIFDSATNDPGHIFYDGVDQGPIAPIGGPYTLVFPATPGFHVYEFRHGTTDPDPSGLIVPVVTVDYTLTVPPAGPFPVMIVQAVTPDGSQKIVRYYDGQGNLFYPQPGDIVTIGECAGGPGNPVETVSSQHFDAIPGSPWTPALVVGTVTGLTYTIISGTADVEDSNGTVITALPAGYSATWNAEDPNTLAPLNSITSIGGRVIVNWSER